MLSMSDLDVKSYISHPSSRSSNSAHSSLTFTIGAHVLFSVAVNASCTFWNVSCPCTNCGRSSNLSLGKSLAYEHNSFRFLQFQEDNCSQQPRAKLCTLCSQPRPWMYRKRYSTSVGQLLISTHSQRWKDAMVESHWSSSALVPCNHVKSIV